MATTAKTAIRLSDEVSHRRAIEHAATILDVDGEPTVVWDADHALQGHLEIAGRHLVLIAPRSADHEPLLLTEPQWDLLRRDHAGPRASMSVC